MKAYTQLHINIQFLTDTNDDVDEVIWLIMVNLLTTKFICNK